MENLWDPVSEGASHVLHVVVDLSNNHILCILLFIHELSDMVADLIRLISPIPQLIADIFNEW